MSDKGASALSGVGFKLVVGPLFICGKVGLVPKDRYRTFRLTYMECAVG